MEIGSVNQPMFNPAFERNLTARKFASQVNAAKTKEEFSIEESGCHYQPMKTIMKKLICAVLVSLLLATWRLTDRNAAAHDHDLARSNYFSQCERISQVDCCQRFVLDSEDFDLPQLGDNFFWLAMFDQFDWLLQNNSLQGC
ncbi:hypothetical protein [Collimonas silvisoli]|uniref:hypothetical protein n=1 Tax=Collimonas silvisoli TaxID=2825884 RepID=UPI001B8C71DD|nr:hypothetical protein [Collimonas silvisoli]